METLCAGVLVHTAKTPAFSQLVADILESDGAEVYVRNPLSYNLRYGGRYVLATVADQALRKAGVVLLRTCLYCSACCHDTYHVRPCPMQVTCSHSLTSQRHAERSVRRCVLCTETFTSLRRLLFCLKLAVIIQAPTNQHLTVHTRVSVSIPQAIGVIAADGTLVLAPEPTYPVNLQENDRCVTCDLSPQHSRRCMKDTLQDCSKRMPRDLMCDSSAEAACPCMPWSCVDW